MLPLQDASHSFSGLVWSFPAKIVRGLLVAETTGVSCDTLSRLGRDRVLFPTFKTSGNVSLWYNDGGRVLMLAYRLQS